MIFKLNNYLDNYRQQGAWVNRSFFSIFLDVITNVFGTSTWFLHMVIICSFYRFIGHWLLLLTPKALRVFLLKTASKQPLLKASRTVQTWEGFGYIQP